MRRALFGSASCACLVTLRVSPKLIQLVNCCTQGNRRAGGGRGGVLVRTNCSTLIVTVEGLGWVGYLHGGSHADSQGVSLESVYGDPLLQRSLPYLS